MVEAQEILGLVLQECSGPEDRPSGDRQGPSEKAVHARSCSLEIHCAISTVRPDEHLHEIRSVAEEFHYDHQHWAVERQEL